MKVGRRRRSWFGIIALGAAVGCQPPAHPRIGGAYIENDLPRALSEGKRTHRPVVVDVWASWCIPCRKMAATLEDPAVTSLHERFIWASLDNDNEVNAAAFRRYPRNGLPTLWVIDAESETVVFVAHGAANARVLRRLLLASEQATHGTTWDPESLASRWVTALESDPPQTLDERVAVAERLVPAYRTIGAPERAIPIMNQLEQDLPGEPGPAIILGRIYLDLGRIEEARAAVARALSHEVLRAVFDIYDLRADIEKKVGAREAEIAVLEDAIATAKQIERNDPSVSSIRSSLEARLRETQTRRP